MNFTKFHEINYSNLSVLSQFEAVSDMFSALHADYQERTQNNKELPLEDYKKLIQLMVERYESVDYSIDIKTSIQAASMKAAELICDDSKFFEAYERWDKFRKSDYKEFSRSMQLHINRAFSIQRRWGEINRETYFEMIYEPAYRDEIFGERRLLMASFGNAGFSSKNAFKRCSKPTQSEIIKMNYHPHFTKKGIIQWCSAQLHENGHAVEDIEYTQKKYMGAGSAVMDNDEQLLLADRKYPQTKIFRKLAYDAYRARPSERLNRFAQKVFDNQMLNQLKQIKLAA